MDHKQDFTLDVHELNQQRSTVSIMIDKGSVARIQHRSAEYKALPYRLRPALERVADYMRTQMIPEVFQKEGPGWAPLANRTVRDRLAGGFGGRHPILRRTGDLYKELTEKSHPQHIEIIKTGTKARIEIGGSSKKFLQNQQGNTAQHLPARPMIPGTGGLPIHQRDRIQVANIFRDAIKRSIQ